MPNDVASLIFFADGQAGQRHPFVERPQLRPAERSIPFGDLAAGVFCQKVAPSTVVSVLDSQVVEVSRPQEVVLQHILEDFITLNQSLLTEVCHTLALQVERLSSGMKGGKTLKVMRQCRTVIMKKLFAGATPMNSASTQPPSDSSCYNSCPGGKKKNLL